MSKRNQVLILTALLLVLAGVIYSSRNHSSGIITVSSADEKVKPLQVEDPALHLQRLEQIRKLEYTGTHRNIFDATPLPPPPALAKKAAQVPAGPPVPPPVEVPVTFFGMATDSRTGQRRAFFTNGDDVYILSEGQTLLGRFRLLYIGNNTADLEEISSGRRVTVTMVQPPSE